MLETFTIDTFSVGDVFKVFYEQNQYVEITLAKAYFGKYKNPLSNRETFLWVFRSNKEIWIEPGCYKMEQEKKGEFDLSITPTMPLVEEGQFNYYEAAFS